MVRPSSRSAELGASESGGRFRAGGSKRSTRRESVESEGRRGRSRESEAERERQQGKGSVRSRLPQECARRGVRLAPVSGRSGGGRGGRDHKVPSQAANPPLPDSVTREPGEPILTL